MSDRKKQKESPANCSAGKKNHSPSKGQGSRAEEEKSSASTSEDFPVRARVKLTLHSHERFFGPGICELLEQIALTGSIQAAAAVMEMSYTKAWRILNRAEKEMETRLVKRVNGGKNGGSSSLTDAGETAVASYREMEKKLSETADELLEIWQNAFSRK